MRAWIAGLRRTVRGACLRAAARTLERCGSRTEFDYWHRPPAPRSGKHAGIVRRLRIGISPFLPMGRVVVESASVAMPGRGDFTYRTPDLAICPTEFLNSDTRFLHAQAVDTAVEVIADTATEEEIAHMVTWYGMAGVPSLLVVDPRTDRGSWTLHSEPITGSYWLTQRGTFGAPVRFRHLALDLSTAELEIYGWHR